MTKEFAMTMPLLMGACPKFSGSHEKLPFSRLNSIHIGIFGANSESVP